MLKIARYMTVILVTLIIGLLATYTDNAYAAKAKTYQGKVKKIELGDGKLTIATEAGDKTFNVTDKTSVKIIDANNNTMEADIASILNEEKNGADEADTAEITSKDEVTATKIVATTVRRMTFGREEAKLMTEEILRGNAEVREKAKIVTANPGTIKGKIKLISKKPLIDTIVYIEKIRNNDFESVQRDNIPETIGQVGRKAYEAPIEYPAMDQLSMAFKPHVLPVLKGSVIDFPNRDVIVHNVFSPDPIPGAREKMNLGTYPSGVTKTLHVPESGEMALLCNVHSDMSGYIVTLDNPYFTVTDIKGNFEIGNVPAGAYTLKTWHECYKSVSRDVTVEAGKVTEIKFPSMIIKKEM